MSTAVLQSTAGDLYGTIPLIIIVALFLLFVLWGLDILEGNV